MTYITQIPLNSYRPETKKFLGSRQVAHATVLQSFPPTYTPEQIGRVLWRIDKDSSSVNLIIISPAQPSVEHIVENCGWASSEVTHQQVTYDALLDSIAVGDEYSFSATINPTVAVTGSNGRNAIEADDIPEWVSSRLALSGVTSKVSVEGYSQDRFRRGEGRVTLAIARVTGKIAVTDPDALRIILLSGMGRAKAYGCGLITLDSKLT